MTTSHATHDNKLRREIKRWLGPKMATACVSVTPDIASSLSQTPTPIATLIGQLQSFFYLDSPLTSKVRYPQALIDALWELDNIVGVDNVKKMVVEQVQYLLLNQWLQRKPMLHGVFYGPPGVGKTRIAKIFAKIWTSIGVLSDKPITSGFGVGSFASKNDKHHGLDPDGQAAQQRAQRLSDAVRRYSNLLGDLHHRAEDILGHVRCLKSKLREERRPRRKIAVAKKETYRGKRKRQPEKLWDSEADKVGVKPAKIATWQGSSVNEALSSSPSSGSSSDDERHETKRNVNDTTSCYQEIWDFDDRFTKEIGERSDRFLSPKGSWTRQGSDPKGERSDEEPPRKRRRLDLDQELAELRSDLFKLTQASLEPSGEEAFVKEADLDDRPDKEAHSDSAVKEEDLYVVAHRGDVVAEYVGQTVPRTLRFLNKHRGKVIVFDEAYLLVTDERDKFGLEALTTINQWADQHPDANAFVFAGYKDKVQETIFRYQPGLARRCRWVFEIEGYTADQLTKILIQQLKIDEWTFVGDQQKLKAWIQQHLDDFPAFGGDMENLAFYVGQQRTNELWTNAWSGVNASSARQVTAKTIKKAFDLLVQNKPLKVEKDKVPDHWYI